MPGDWEINPFGPDLFRFLRGLRRNNDRGWFESRRQRYEEAVREPALAFIRMMARHLRKISPHLVARDRKVGGSLMRVHRDVRFSKNKAPHKTNLGIQFRHESGKDVHAPGLYFHVEPGQCFLGCGMWHPAADALRAMREAIVGDPQGWSRVRDGRRFRAEWRLGGDSLKRAPRGYDPEHPCIDDLKRKDFIAICELTDDEILSADLVPRTARRYAGASRFLQWQAEALDLSW